MPGAGSVSRATRGCCLELLLLCLRARRIRVCDSWQQFIMGWGALLLLGIEDQLVFGGASLILICLGRKFGEGKTLRW